MKCRRAVYYILFVLVMTLSTTTWAYENQEAEGKQSSGVFSKIDGLSVGADLIIDWSRIDIARSAGQELTRGLFDLTVELDFEESFGLAGGLFLAEFYTKRGRNGSDYLGDIHGFSNLEGDDVQHFAQVWYEQWLFDDALRMKVGKVDANSDFAFVSSATDLLNSAAGYSPSILGMPSYPYPAWSVNAFYYPSRGSHVGLGVYNSDLLHCGHGDQAEPEGFVESSSNLFWITEVGFSWQSSKKKKAGRLAIGPWYHTTAVERFDRGSPSNAFGFYAVVEQQLWRPETTSEGKGLNLFVQYGYGDTAICEISHHLSAGLVSAGTLADRQEDAAGIMVTRISLSGEGRERPSLSETVLEFFYRFQISPFFAMTSDLQYIVNPSGHTSADNSWVATFRFEFSISSKDF